METSQSEPEEIRPPGVSRRRRWLFRLVAVLVGLSPFVALEGACLLFDWGRPSLHDDPFIGFRSVRPLFVLDDDRTRYEIPKARQVYFCAESFAAKKAPHEFRIVCLGESTVQGNPWAIETSFATWLEISLQAADPTRRWEVVNCGGISYASYRLAPILEEVLAHEPDLIILCVGHNEFLESRAYQQIADRGRLLNAALDGASRLRTLTLAREGYLRLRGRSSADPPPSRSILATEVEALLDYRGGLEEYHRDDAGRSSVIAHYRFNLRRMVQLAQAAGVEMILINPVSNFADSPPFKSLHRADLSPDEQEEWEQLIESGRRHLRKGDYDVEKAVDSFERACRIDPLYAGGFYNLAKAYEAAGQFDRARKAYLQAKELDVCPLRILEPMSQTVLELARDTETPLLDAQRLFEERSPRGIVGGEWLVDHVHPSIEGHQLLADQLADMLVAQGKLHPNANWQSAKRDRWREHFDSLGDLYFSKANEHMKMLRNWAAGRAKGVRPSRHTAPEQSDQHAGKD